MLNGQREKCNNSWAGNPIEAWEVFFFFIQSAAFPAALFSVFCFSHYSLLAASDVIDNDSITGEVRRWGNVSIELWSPFNSSFVLMTRPKMVLKQTSKHRNWKCFSAVKSGCQKLKKSNYPKYMALKCFKCSDFEDFSQDNESLSDILSDLDCINGRASSLPKSFVFVVTTFRSK